jgi:AmmeMemoRadiSam system protein B
LGLSYGCIVPHSPNLVPQVGRERSREAAATIEAMAELGIIIGEERRAKNCVVVSPHSPFLPEAFGVWEGKRLSGGMERFQAPDVVVSVELAEELATSIVDVSERMEIPVGRLLPEWHLDRGVTVPALYLLKQDEIRVVPVAISMLGWEEHWLFGTAIAKAAERIPGETVIVASSNFSHAIERGRLRELLDIPQDLCREASECGFAPLLVLAGAFDGRNVKGRILSYEAPFGIGYLVAEIKLDEGEKAPRFATASAVTADSGAPLEQSRRRL